jgi:CheY-specific phosphatase CheX
MSVKFFGQFLIEQGEVDASHVREALELMEDTNPTLGELAISTGFLTQRDVSEVSAAQRHRDLCFGDLAVEMGLLAPEELVELVRRQRSRWMPIGQALVELGHVQKDRLGVLLDAFKTDQAQYEVEEIPLPDGLASHGVSRFVLELFPRFMKRIAGLDVRVGDIRKFASRPDFAEIQVSVPLEGPRRLEVVLVSDLEFAEALAIAASGLSPRDVDPEMVADGVGEFLNVLGGNAAGALIKQGHRIELGPPDYEAELCDGWTVDLAVGVGRAALVLSTS